VSAFAAFEYLFDVVELVEGFHRSEVVDIEMKQFVAYLCEDRVVELEEVEL
jgi:hypothetical protein